MAAWQIGAQLHVGAALDDVAMSAIGGTLFLAAVIGCCLIRRRAGVGPQLTQEQP
jgi:hypothetical protein